jgi:hypothetical protein
MMDGVRTTQTPELSSEAIEAARQRRAVSNRLEKPLGDEMRDVAVPTNHPWATSRGKLSAEEEEAKRKEIMRVNATPTRRSAGGAGAPAE